MRANRHSPDHVHILSYYFTQFLARWTHLHPREPCPISLAQCQLGYDFAQLYVTAQYLNAAGVIYGERFDDVQRTLMLDTLDVLMDKLVALVDGGTFDDLLRDE